MPRSRRLALVGALGAGLLTVGCSSGSPEPSARSTPSVTAGVTGGATTSAAPGSQASPVPTVEPAPAAPAAAPGKRGQEAFARHVIDLWGYALRTNDPKPLAALGAGAKACVGCGALAHELARRRTAGWSVDFPGVEVRRLALTKQGSVTVARATVNIPESDSYNTDGSFRNTNPAHRGATFVVQMRFVQQRYRLVAFAVS